MRRKETVHKVTVGGGPAVVGSSPNRLSLMRKSKLMRRRLLGAFYGVGLLLSMAAIGHAGYGFFMDTSYFQLRDKDGIIIVGNLSDEIKPEILELVKSRLPYGGNLLKLDVDDLAEQLSKHPRVSNVKATKAYPDKLYIEADERTAGAIINSGGANFYLIDWNGYVMERLSIEKLAQYDLPYISGVRADNIQVGEKLYQPSLGKALDLILMAEERNAEFYEKLSEVAIQTDGVSPLETLSAKMKGGLEVFFGDGNPVDRMAEYESIINKIRADKLDPYSDIVYVELRYKDMAFYLDRESMLLQETQSIEEIQMAMEEERKRIEQESLKAAKAANASNSSSQSSSRSAASSQSSRGQNASSRNAGRPRSSPQTGSVPPQYQPQYRQGQQSYYPQQPQVQTGYYQPGQQFSTRQQPQYRAPQQSYPTYPQQYQSGR